MNPEDPNSPDPVDGNDEDTAEAVDSPAQSPALPDVLVPPAVETTAETVEDIADALTEETEPTDPGLTPGSGDEGAPVLPEWPEDDTASSTGCLKALAACGCFFILVLTAILALAVWVGFDAADEAKSLFSFDAIPMEDTGSLVPEEEVSPTAASEEEAEDEAEASDPRAKDPRWRETRPRRKLPVATEPDTPVSDEPTEATEEAEPLPDEGE